MSFVHLHARTHFSLLESSSRIAELVSLAKKYEMPAVAITDNGNMFGAIEFYFACKKSGIKPILGIDVYMAPKGRHSKGEDIEAARLPNSRLVLLAKSFDGYQTLCKISSIGFQEGFYYKPRVDFEVLKENNKDIIALTGGLRGEVCHAFFENGPEAALNKVRELKSIFGENLYLEIQRGLDPKWEEIEPFLIGVSKSEGVPLVATNDIYYSNKGDNLAQEVLVCIGSNKTLQDESRWKMATEEYYFKSADQMKALFEDLPEAIENTLKIAELCKVEFRLKDEQGKPIYHLPTYPTTDGRSIEEEMRTVALSGLEARFVEAMNRGEEILDKDRYYKRLEFEMGVIKNMGFIGYFMIVQDFIQWAKNNGIPVGPGRGSGAGSLVAYSLKITDLDPMRYNLIFERFLNPERISMPDFDIDFCQDRRQEVIDYVTQKYGQACVSQIITFGKLQTKAAIRDVGRVLGMTFAEVDVVAKLIPEELGISIAKSIEKEARLRELMDDDPKISQLMELAQKIEGLNRHASIHAAGVIISDKPLVEHAPLYKGAAGENVVQYDMKYSEMIGLIKFDFLGLKTLTHINNAFKLIEENRGVSLKSEGISMQDPGIYELMSAGNTAGVFQFEGAGITDLIRKVKPTSFEDITAINALYRPGPMQMLEEYTARKHGTAKITYLFDELEDILKETYGIIVYQEQVQLIAARIAKYSLGEADILRRAMGKKIPEEMAKQRERFLQGAKSNGFDTKKSEELFDLMDRFAAYGFNKSHAAAYCVVAAQTAWLKRYYPVEFYAALLSTEMSNTEKVVQYTKDARSHGIEVKPPHINYSDYKFAARGEQIFFGLGAIKGVGEGPIENIVRVRSELPDKKFHSIEEFFDKMDGKTLNKKVLECLIKAGALDDFGATRAQLWACYETLLERSGKTRKDREIGQTSLFELESADTEKFEFPTVVDWRKRERLAKEKEVLGFFLSDHPLIGMDHVLDRFVSIPISKLKEMEGKSRVIIGGLITGVRERLTRKATLMAFFSVEDLTGETEVIAFPDSYDHIKRHLVEDEICLITGVVERDGDSIKVIAEDLITLENKMKTSKRVLFRLLGEKAGQLDEIKSLIEKHPGDSTVQIELNLDDQYGVLLELENNQGVVLSREFFESVQAQFGATDFVSIH